MNIKPKNKECAGTSNDVMEIQTVTDNFHA